MLQRPQSATVKVERTFGQELTPTLWDFALHPGRRELAQTGCRYFHGVRLTLAPRRTGRAEAGRSYPTATVT